ncbi:MAG: site-specific DNA-methyltransferase [candidate division WOR-3 bacterium]
MTNEQKFYNELEKIFIGVKIEGESGYINLMRIKSNYYTKGVFPKLKEDIDRAVEQCSDPAKFKEELFEKLYTFFKSYFSESGSVYFNFTPSEKDIYEKVYTDDRDVVLFWKTHMLYYVKSERLFKNLEVEVNGYRFFFDVSRLEHKKANEKRAIIFEFKEVRDDNVIVFDVFYSERGRLTKIEEILKSLKKEDINITEEILEKAFRVFEQQSEVDYFINKDAKKFLEEQFNPSLYQYVFKKPENEWTEERIKQLQVYKDIAYKIIAFIAQFEDELVKIWNKPKFVFNSNYVISLDRIYQRDGGVEIIRKILRHNKFTEQIKEWKELGIVGGDFNKRNILRGDNLADEYKHLPIDTRYFKDLELEILGLFDNLDESLDGWLIKSENYQALNTILPKFKEKVQTIYIDPPFNKEQDADYFYSVKYKDSSWATLLENRIRLSRDLLSDKGSIFVRCDYNGNWIVRPLMDEIFGKENFRNEIIISRTKAKQEVGNQFVQQTESLFFYSKSEYLILKEIERPRSPEWHPLLHFPRADETPRIILGQKFYPPKGRRWALSQKRISKFEEEGKIRINKDLSYVDCRGRIIKGVPELLYDTEVVGNEWIDISGYSQIHHFPTENSEILLKRVIESTSNEGDLVMDFFLGSGTATAVAHKLKRKWIGVEMGEHFWTVVLPRMKKVLAYDKSGISKEKDVKEKYNEDKAGGFFKYYELEQYEDALRKVKYQNSELFENPYQDIYNQYIFMKDKKMLDVLEVDYENNRVKVDLSKLYSKERDGKEIDIAETLSNLKGKWIKKITKDRVIFEDNTEIDLNNLDYKEIKPLIWWD